jgi:hypothetical protein
VAEHVASFEARQVKEVRALVEREGIDCEFEEVIVRDICLYPAGRDKVRTDLITLYDAGISTVREVDYSSDEEAEQVCKNGSRTWWGTDDSCAHRFQVSKGRDPASRSTPLACGHISL